ncbi:hypothetical protein GH714_035694 [Hevea brasiliensis]|uniref:Uncharacterized protein n=1 Tax=Hevea brasiliensis TaxID=3981 RepID=A0A6A6NCM0_HEVBR|nr:hypothetical protein GH714_035694 [Hevea brasiliensis]
MGINVQNSKKPQQSTIWPYDPLSNYLSPRPKFLRYKLTGARNYFLEEKNQAKEGNDDGLTIVGNGSLKTEKGISSEANLASSCGSLATGFNDANVKQESELMDESEDEFEELCEKDVGVLEEY